MTRERDIFHARKAEYKSPFGALPNDTPLALWLYPPHSLGAGPVYLCIRKDGQDEVRHSMRWCGLVGSCDQYTISLPMAEIGLYWYDFIIETQDGPYYIGRGFGGRGELLERRGDPFQLTVFDAAYLPPDWFGQGITYQIFPDRFCRDRQPVQPEGEGVAERVLHESWQDTPIFAPDQNGEVKNNDFFGGNLQGIVQKLPYLASLSVKTIYLNPIFKAYSNHRYDTGDYHEIDPLLGSLEDFRALCTAAAGYGMRVVLDGVFNHTGSDSRYFNATGRYQSLGAAQSADSPYFEWYEFSEWPHKYSAWWGIGTLPQVREMTPSYLDYIIEDENSVVRRWLRCGAAGWRLDVADELPDEFIQRLNAAAKREKPDALIIGEVWEDASNKIAYDKRRKYLQGGELDSVMNYPLREAILAFLGGGTAEHFAEQIETLREHYPRAVFYNLMNAIGTHDTPRALTLLGAEPEDMRLTKAQKAGYRLSPERLERGLRRLRLAAVLQFMLPGSPTIYYGDEAGMQGFEDPLNRMGYPWGEENAALLSFYQKLGRLRIGHRALYAGELCFVPQSEGGLLAFLREDENECIAVLVNRALHGVHPQIYAPRAVELLTGEVFEAEDGRLPLRLLPESAYILRLFGRTKEEDEQWI